MRSKRFFLGLFAALVSLWTEPCHAQWSQQSPIVVSADHTNGMKATGYEYLDIDDLWQGQRDAAGNIQADPTRFPSGIKPLADYVHSQGLKLGIYSDAGDRTCGGRPGSLDHEFQKTKTYAEWGLIMLNTTGATPRV